MALFIKYWAIHCGKDEVSKRHETKRKCYVTNLKKISKFILINK